MNDYVRIDRAEYERLCAAAEELENLRTFDRAAAALADGTEELIPAAFAKRLVAGESPLRIFRELRGLSQTTLAARSGVNRVQIADIEAGRKNGSVETLGKLAGALGVMIDDLV